VFRIIDKDCSGVVSRGELSRGFRQLGVHLSEEEWNHVFTVIDTDDTGRINYTEFLNAVHAFQRGGWRRVLEVQLPRQSHIRSAGQAAQRGALWLASKGGRAQMRVIKCPPADHGCSDAGGSSTGQHGSQQSQQCDVAADEGESLDSAPEAAYPCSLEVAASGCVATIDTAGEVSATTDAMEDPTVDDTEGHAAQAGIDSEEVRPASSNMDDVHNAASRNSMEISGASGHSRKGDGSGTALGSLEQGSCKDASSIRGDGEEEEKALGVPSLGGLKFYPMSEVATMKQRR